MKKLIYLLTFILSFFVACHEGALAQTYNGTGASNLQRAATAKGYIYRNNMGALGNVNWWTKEQVDSLINIAIASGVTSFNGRTGTVVPLTGDYAAFYQTLANLSTSTSLGASNTLYPSQNAVKTYVDNAIAGNTYTAGYALGLTAFEFRADTSILATHAYTARYPLKSTTVAGFDLRGNITLASLTNGYGFSSFTYNGSSAVAPKIDTALIQTVANFFPKGDTRWAPIIGGGYIQNKYGSTTPQANSKIIVTDSIKTQSNVIVKPVLSSVNIYNYGNSITRGFAATPPPTGGYAYKVDSAYHMTGVNHGVDGAVIDILLTSGGFSAIPNYTTGAIYTFMWGTNEANPITGISVSQYRAKYNALIDSVHTLKGVPLSNIWIFGCPYTVNPTNISTAEQYAAVDSLVAADKGVRFVENYHWMKNNGSITLLQPDGEHFTDIGNRSVAAHIIATLNDTLLGNITATNSVYGNHVYANLYTGQQATLNSGGFNYLNSITGIFGNTSPTQLQTPLTVNYNTGSGYAQIITQGGNGGGLIIGKSINTASTAVPYLFALYNGSSYNTTFDVNGNYHTTGSIEVNGGTTLSTSLTGVLKATAGLVAVALPSDVLTPVSQFLVGSVGFSNASGIFNQDNLNFYWDNSNKRLGLGTNTPSMPLDVIGNIKTDGVYFNSISNGSSTDSVLTKSNGFIKAVPSSTYQTKITFGTGVQAALANNVGSAGAPVLYNGAGGTPSSIVLTNGTGTAAGLSIGGNAATATIASTVTTNANLTGDATSVGNATTVVKINGTSLSGLTTGLLKNTTSTGVPSIAVAGTDYAAPNQTMFIGTTSVAINRASATLNLAGIGSLGMGGALSGVTTLSMSGLATIGGGASIAGSVRVTNSTGLSGPAGVELYYDTSNDYGVITAYNRTAGIYKTLKIQDNLNITNTAFSFATGGTFGGAISASNLSGTNTGDQTTSSANSDISVATGSANPVLTFNRAANFAFSGNNTFAGTSGFNQRTDFNFGSYFNSSPDFVSGAISIRDGAGSINLYNVGNTFATTFTYVRPTANRGITLPDATGTVSLLTSTETLTNKTLTTPKLTGYTVATLPAGTVGMLAYVTDALAPSFLVTVVGGGAVTTPVFYNGTNWVAQ